MKEGDPTAATCKAIRPVLEACNEKAETLGKILEKVIPPDNVTHVERYWKAMRALGKGNQVESLMTGILDDLHMLASNRGMKTATAAHIEQISKAIGELEAIPASVPDDVFTDTYTNINNGPGPQNIHQGIGDQHNNTNSGSGTLNVAHEIKFESSKTDL